MKCLRLTSSPIRILAARASGDSCECRFHICFEYNLTLDASAFFIGNRLDTDVVSLFTIIYALTKS